MKYCPNCGAPNVDAYAFCTSCGNQFAKENDKETKQEQSKEVEAEIATEKSKEQIPEVKQEDAPDSLNETQPDPQPEQQPEQQPEPRPEPQTTPGFVPQPGNGQTTARQQNGGYGFYSLAGVAPRDVPNPVIQAIRKAGSSTLFLIATILFSAAIILSIINSAIVKDVTIDEVLTEKQMALLERIAESYDFNINTINQNSNSTVTGEIFANAFSIITAVGLWMFYAASKSKRGVYSTSGLTVIKVINIIKTVLLCIAFAIIELSLFICILNVPNIIKLMKKVDVDNILQFDLTSIMAGLLVISIIIIAAVFAIYIIYLLFITASINNVKKSITYGIASDRVSTYVGVINIISAVLGLLGIFRSYTMVQALATLATSAFLIIISVCIFSYKKTMKQIIFMNQMQQVNPPAGNAGM